MCLSCSSVDHIVEPFKLLNVVVERLSHMPAQHRCSVHVDVGGLPLKSGYADIDHAHHRLDLGPKKLQVDGLSAAHGKLLSAITIRYATETSSVSASLNIDVTVGAAFPSSMRLM